MTPQHRPDQPVPHTARPAAVSEDAWLDVLSAVDRTYADLVDYQERLERQNARLQEMQAFLTSILASVSDVLIVLDRAGAIEQVSASLLARTGRAEAALTGQPAGALLPAADATLLRQTLERLRGDRRPAVLELSLATPGGPEPLELSVAPRLDDRGRVAGFVLTGRPLGELRRAYAELSDSHDALKSAQSLLVRNEKLASLGRLLAGVAHELNNPISFVYANAHALDRYVGKFETYFARVQEGASREALVALREELRLDREITNLRQATQGARDGAERVRDIVEDLRRLSSEGTGEKLVFDLVETARVAAHWVLRGARDGARLEIRAAGPVPAWGRPGHVQQIVMNLVQNAVDAVEGREDGAVVLTLSAEGGRARLTVSDNGPGVPAGARGAIFDPFFTTKSVGRGTGLGLSISLKVAEEHGGALTLCEGPGPGACFLLDLPAAPGEAP